MVKKLTPDQRRARTRKEKYGEDFYRKIGSKGGKNSPSQFTSQSGTKAVEARWAKYRETKTKVDEYYE